MKHPYRENVDIGEGRTCSQCEDWKSWTEFNKNKFNVSFGMRSYCKECGKDMYKRNTALRNAEMSK